MKTQKHIMHALVGMISLMVVIVIAQSFKQAKDIVRYAVNFDECIANGNGIRESYPGQCQAKNGKIFIEVVKADADDQNVADELTFVKDDFEVIETMQMSVAAEKSECGSFSGEKCLVVNGEFFYEPIENFRHNHGYEYQITVEKYLRFGTDDPTMIPQDVGMFGYKLISYDSVEVADSFQGCRVTRGCGYPECVSDDWDPAGVYNTCEFKSEYTCYKDALCEVQTTGECGWTETEELTQCLQDPTNFEI